MESNQSTEPVNCLYVIISDNDWHLGSSDPILSVHEFFPGIEDIEACFVSQFGTIARRCVIFDPRTVDEILALGDSEFVEGMVLIGGGSKFELIPRTHIFKTREEAEQKCNQIQ